MSKKHSSRVHLVKLCCKGNAVKNFEIEACSKGIERAERRDVPEELALAPLVTRPSIGISE